MFVLDGLVELDEQFVKSGVFLPLDHGEEVELPLCDVYLMGTRIQFATDSVDLGAKPLDVASADIGDAVDGKSRDFLPFSLLREPGLRLIDGEPVPSNDIPQLLHERFIVMIDMVVAAEGDVIGIAGVGEMESPCQSVQLPVQPHGADIGEDRGGRRSLREDIDDTAVLFHRVGAQRGDHSCGDGGDTDVCQGQFDHVGCDGGEEILEIQVKDIVSGEVAACIVDDGASGDESHGCIGRLIYTFKDKGQSGQYLLEPPGGRSRDRPFTSALLRDPELRIGPASAVCAPVISQGGQRDRLRDGKIRDIDANGVDGGGQGFRTAHVNAAEESFVEFLFHYHEEKGWKGNTS